MSKDLYIHCSSHGAQSDEVGHADIAILEVRDWIDRRRELVEAWNKTQDLFDVQPSDIWDSKLRNTLYFLRAHLDCNDLELIDEYGKYYDLSADPEECFAWITHGDLKLVCDRDQADGHQNHIHEGTDDRGMSFKVTWNSFETEEARKTRRQKIYNVGKAVREALE